ncbi:Zinc carboxypeptidase [Spirosomataceae bacterium TFI 002]|nr:Zinc carboxypeptidase [Spirosomataceae bacterium TFI 002]
MKKTISGILLFSFTISCALAQTTAQLPPILKWSGKSEKHIRQNGDKWITPAERSNFDSTALIDETIGYFERLATSSNLVSVEMVGQSSGGKPIHLIKVSKDKSFHNFPNNNKPILLAQAGIHAGEIDGKDASMMLVRDLVASKSNLLDKVNLIIVPVFNVEGHERISQFNRMNQRGPLNMGWRTNGKNLNLNRDYTKAETLEMATMIEVINAYKPSLYLDIHVTDGADYQYDITYGYLGEHGYSPNISKWLNSTLRPFVDNGLKAEGHIPGPLLFAKNGENFDDGNLDYTFNPDFSHAYGDAIHLPTVLVENHSLKPFKQRVLGTYVLMESCLKLLAKENTSLAKAIDSDKSSKKENIGVNWVFSNTSEVSNTNPWNAENKNAKSVATEIHLGVKHKGVTSEITGKTYSAWTGVKEEKEIAVFRNSIAKDQIKLPKAYVVPAFQDEVIEKLLIHHIDFELIENDTTISATGYEMSNPKFANSPFEGRIKVNADLSEKTVTKKIPAGSLLVHSNQEKFTLAALLLEPSSPSSLFQWGFMNHIFNRTEYIESYAMEPYMAAVLEQNQEIKTAFEQKMKDESFAKNPRAIFEWFYTQSPFDDETYLQYPILKIF